MGASSKLLFTPTYGAFCALAQTRTCKPAVEWPRGPRVENMLQALWPITGQGGSSRIGQLRGSQWRACTLAGTMCLRPVDQL